MKRFYIGMRVDEILAVYPSKDDAYPTTFRFRNGSTLDATGEWRQAVREIEAILAANDEEAHSSQHRHDALVREVAEAERKLEELRSAAELVTADDENGKLALVLAGWLHSGRAYLRSDEKEAVKRWLDQAKAEVGS